jgi:hypothetical protein
MANLAAKAAQARATRHNSWTRRSSTYLRRNCNCERVLSVDRRQAGSQVGACRGGLVSCAGLISINCHGFGDRSIRVESSRDAHGRIPTPRQRWSPSLAALCSAAGRIQHPRGEGGRVVLGGETTRLSRGEKRGRQGTETRPEPAVRKGRFGGHTRRSEGAPRRRAFAVPARECAIAAPAIGGDRRESAVFV